MAIIPSYPKATPGPEDLLLGVNVIPEGGVDARKTRSFQVSSIISMATAAVAPDISGKEDVVNKSASTSLGTSDILYPTQNAVKTYVDNNVPVIQPVSATQTGVVNNTSLQELGGVDKTINGVRIGRGNLASSTSNTAVGYQALQSNINTTGSEGRFNTAFGSEALKTLTTGYLNDAFGQYALRLCTTGTFNLAIGNQAMANSTTATINTAIGQYALRDNISGSKNTAVGNSALMQNTGSFNTAIGSYAGGVVSSTGTENILIGYQAGGYISSGRNNLLIENVGSIASITSGSYNIVLNPKQKSGVKTGSYNTIIGCWDGTFPDAMLNNVILGDGQGNIRFRTTNTGLTTVPGQTNALITADTTGKAVVTKEYLSGVATPYKVYTALISQEAELTPVPTVLENTLSGVIDWTRDSAGNYIGTLNGAFPLGKTVCFYTHDGWNGSTGYGGLVRSSSNTVWMTFNNPAGEYVDTQGQSDSIEIRVYN